MPHSMTTFSLHRTAVIFIVIGSLLIALLIFAGGYLLGSRSSGARLPHFPLRQPPAQVKPPPGGQPVVEPPSAPLAVRAGVFDSEEEAKALAQQFAARKLAAEIVPLTTSAGVTLYTVQVGRYPTRAAAAAAASALADEYGLQPAVVPAQ